MKFIVTFFFILWYNSAFTKTNLIKPVKEFRLLAQKGEVKKYYTQGNGVAIVFGETTTEKIKGYIVAVKPDSVTLTTSLSAFTKNFTSTRTIAINQIQTITNINVKSKKQYIITAVVLVFLAGVFGLLYAQTNPVANGFIAIIAIIFGVSAFYVLLFSFLFIWGKQWITKRRKSKGWNFSAALK